LWQNNTALKRSIQILQQRSELQAGSIAQEAANLCFQSNNLQWLKQQALQEDPVSTTVVLVLISPSIYQEGLL